MNDASILINGYRSPANQRSSAQPQAFAGATDGSNNGVVRADHAAVSVGPFEHLLREIQQSVRPRASRLNESGASEMFESRPGAANSSNADASNDAERASELEANEAKTSTQSRFSDAARRSRNVGESDRNLGQDSDRRISAKPTGASFDCFHDRSAPDSQHASVTLRPIQAAEPGSRSSGSPSQSSVGAPSTPGRAATSTSTPQPGNVAAVNATASSLHEVSAPPQPASTSGATGTTDGPRSASVADRLAPVLAELVRDGAKSPRPAAGSFQDELAKTTGKQERSLLRTPSDAASDASRAAAEAESDRTGAPSPFVSFIRSIRMQGGESRSSARIRLNPPELGAMTVYVRVNGDRIRVDVRTESADAARRLQSHVADLKTALRQQGLSVDAVAVEVVDAMSTLAAEATPLPNSTHRSTLGTGRQHEPRAAEGSEQRMPTIENQSRAVRASNDRTPSSAASHKNRNDPVDRLNLDA